MKIAYLSTFYPFRGGIAQFNASVYRELEKSNEIKAFTFLRQYPDFLFPGTSQMVGAEDKVDKIESARVLDTINPITYLSTARRIIDYKPDLLIMKYWMPFFAPSLGYVAGKIRKSGAKVISVLDNVIPHEKRPGDISLTNYFLNRCSGFVAMSNNVKNDLIQLKPSAEYIMLDHPLYDHFGEKIDQNTALEKLNIPLGSKVLLFFGFIRGYKGLDLLIEAVSKLPDDYILLVAGEMYGDFGDYQKQIDKLGISDKIRLNVRYISDSEVPLFFSASDVLVLPYKSATQSGIIGISYHFDLPVIATDVGGLREMIEPHGTGVMCSSPNVDELVQSITEYFSSNTQVFEDNIKLYKEKYTWANFSKELLIFANKIV